MTMTQVTQRQSIHYSGSLNVLRHLITQVAGLVETIDGDKKMKAFKAIDISIEGKIISLEVTLFVLPSYILGLKRISTLHSKVPVTYILFQWVANPVNDMYSDSIVAAILQADLLDAPVKSSTINAKVDRMHFKVNFKV